jgi:hypothetical protein
MPGRGKYTTYVSNDNTRNAFFKTLFAGSPFAADDAFYSSQGNLTVAEKVAAYAYTLLLANGGVQKGDPGHFPAGVDMSFSAGPNIPEDVKKDTADKDLASAWFPNVISPGPAPGIKLSAVGPGDVMTHIEPLDAAETLAGIDIIDPGYIQTDNTANPADTSVKIAEHGVLPADLPTGFNVNK